MGHAHFRSYGPREGAADCCSSGCKRLQSIFWLAPLFSPSKCYYPWQTMSGEEKAADEAAAAKWREEKFPEMVESYSTAGVFNVYVTLPTSAGHDHAFQGERIKGGEPNWWGDSRWHMTRAVIVLCTQSIISSTPLHTNNFSLLITAHCCFVWHMSCVLYPQQMLTCALWSVTSTIQHCWKKAGLMQADE